MYVERLLEASIMELLTWSPAVAIIGARQVGKSTLASHLVPKNLASVYLDLEDPRNKLRLSDPFLFFDQFRDGLICLDEVQVMPDLFVHIKAYIDQYPKSGQFLMLGSAAPALLKQSAQSLAGRLIYQNLGPFNLLEVKDFQRLWLRGGFPRSYLAPEDQLSFTWRLSFIQTFLARDILQLRQGVSPVRTRRLWTMLAHLHGQLLNQSHLSRAMDVSNTTIASYIDLLEGAFMIIRVPPYVINTKKRLIKSPKIYLSDTGILHNLLGVSTYEQLLSHPIRGVSLEGLVLQNILSALPSHRVSFYRTASGAEMDFILEYGGKVIAVEVKASSIPHLTKGFWNAIEDVQPDSVYVIAPVAESYFIRDDVQVTNLQLFLEQWT